MYITVLYCTYVGGNLDYCALCGRNYSKIGIATMVTGEGRDA